MTVDGVVTRGTTAPRRLHRVDRWLLSACPGLLRTADLLVVDLGFGASPVTTLELARRIQARNPAARVVGLDVDRDRVASAATAAVPDGVRFDRGGFELAGLRPHLVRALNVLRQYDEAAVADAWRTMTGGLAPGGLLVEGTCDELGRLGAWVALDAAGPRSLTLAVDLRREPSAVGARLPKALIHRNVPGEPVHALLTALDGRWRARANLGVFSARQRFAATVADLRDDGWPVLDGPRRWARGDVTISWSAIRPVPR